MKLNKVFCKNVKFNVPNTYALLMVINSNSDFNYMET